MRWIRWQVYGVRTGWHALDESAAPVRDRGFFVINDNERGSVVVPTAARSFASRWSRVSAPHRTTRCGITVPAHVDRIEEAVGVVPEGDASCPLCATDRPRAAFVRTGGTIR